MIYGDRIEQYELLGAIGKGGFATVHKARCKNTEELVAIKMICLSKAKSSLKRINEEISVHSKLEHPSILKLYTHFKDEKYINIVLELCTKDLEKHRCSLREQRLDESEARRYLSQIVKGMIYLNEKNILHRDLKLANTLLTETNVVKIADFGLATQLKGENDCRMSYCGTPNYISPEVISREQQTLRMDVWSLGVMLYTMLVGKEPFVSSSVKETLKMIEKGEFNLPSYLSLESTDLIKKCPKPESERISLEDIKRHRFLAPHCGGSNAYLRDSGLHTVSIGGSHTQQQLAREPSLEGGSSEHRCRQAQSSGPTYHRPSTLPARNPDNLLKNRSAGDNESARKGYHTSKGGYTNIASDSPPVPSLVPPLNAVRSERRYAKAPESKGSSGKPMKAVHDMGGVGPHYSVQRMPDFIVEESETGVFQPAYPGREDCSSTRNHSSTEMVDKFPRASDSKPPELSSYQHSCCQASRHRSWCERQIYSQQPSDRQPSGVLGEINRPKTSLADNCHSSLAKSHHLSREGTMVDGSTPTERTRPLPLSSLRCRKTRQVKKFSVVSILADSVVCVEYLKKKQSGMRVIEVWKVSANGNDIVVYRPNGKEGVEVGECPPNEPNGSHIRSYTLDSLPEKLWKNYSDAFTFAENVKANTRKISVENEEQTAHLMENGDVKAVFKNGYKFVFTSKRDPLRGKLDAKVNFTKDNHTYTSPTADCSFESKEDSILFKKSCKIRDYMLSMEEHHTKFETVFPVFPLRIYLGRRSENAIASDSKDTRCGSNYRSSNKENTRYRREPQRRI